MASLTSEKQEAFDFHTRKFERERIDFQSLLERVNECCKKVQAGERFESSAAMAFLRDYAVVRSIAVVAQNKEHLSNYEKEHLSKYGITSEHLNMCQKIVSSMEGTRLESHLKSTLFHEVKQAPFGRHEFEKLFNHFAIVAGLIDKPHS